MFRTGLGYDSHRFDAERPLMLGGVAIPGAPGLGGHSDADVVLHALTDALLGAIGADDIGELFPDTDPALAGADSTKFVTRAMELVTEAGFLVANADITILAETPKLKSHKPAIRESVASLLNVEVSQVAIKAKTNEQMGAIGRSEGIAVLASVLVMQKNAC